MFLRSFRRFRCSKISLARKFSEIDYQLLDKFIAAAKQNNEAECESLLEDEPWTPEILNGTDTFGNSPLMLMSQRNWTDAMEKLLELNCDVNHQNVFGSSALMCGASHGYAEAVIVLLKCNRVQIDLLSRYGQTALMKAVQAGKLNTFLILVQAGADLKIKNKQGRSAYDIAMERNQLSILEELQKRGYYP